jgi:hypothetical protein
MSTVGSGITPDPNALHYQPPVPDTTNGPYQYTYVPRSDPVGPQYAVPQGFGAGTGGPAFYTPAGIPYQQVHPHNFLPLHTAVMGASPLLCLMVNASLTPHYMQS